MQTASPSSDRFPSVDLFRPFEPRVHVSDATIRTDRSLSLSGLRVIHLGFSREDGILLSEAMHEMGARDVIKSEQVYPLGLGKPGNHCYDGVVINLDRFGDVDLGVDRLMRYRRACPRSFVVLATAGVATDDLGHHRRAICDCTLRLPLTACRLIEALEAALLNHHGRPV